MGDKEGEANPVEEAGDCLSNRPASSSSRPADHEMLEENGEGCRAIPPQGVDPQEDSPPSHSSESPIKRRPGPKAIAGRGHSKKLRQSADQASQLPLGSIPEHGQQTATLEDLADSADHMQESPVSKDPASPSEQPEDARKHPQAMTEIDLDNSQTNVERGCTAATDIQLEAEQRAMQALHALQVALGTAADAGLKEITLPSPQLYSDLPREWPMARLRISNKQVNRLVRTFLWRRVAESALRGTPFGNIPEEINRDYIDDLRRISEAFAAPLSNLFAFAKQEHKVCPFIPQNQLALYANPLFWQYGLLAFVSRCCAHNNQHRSQMASAAKTVLTKQDKSSEKDVDALTFMQTVAMSFARGMEYGEQTLPINDLFVYFPVQLVPALVTAMEQQRFASVEVKGGCGYRPRKQGEEDNPLLVVGVYNKEITYDRYPRMPDTSWAARAYTFRAIDPSLGQAMSFPSLLQLKLRIGEMLQRANTSHQAPRWKSRIQTRLPVGQENGRPDMHNQCQWETEVATEEEDTVAEPTYAFARGFGRFVIRYTRLATALGNFEQGSIQTESTAVAYWLTSGLKVSRVEPALSPIWTDQAPGGATQTLLLPRLPSITRRRSPIPPVWPDSLHRGPLGRTSHMVVW